MGCFAWLGFTQNVAGYSYQNLWALANYLGNQTTVFLDDMANFGEMNGVYEKFFAHKPARSCVAVNQLPKGVPVEIECIALAGGSSKL